MFDALLLITFAVVVTFVAYLAYKIPGLRYVFRLLKYIIIVAYGIMVMGLLIFMFSFFGFAVITLISFKGNDGLIQFAGEPINILIHPEQVFYLSLIFGVLYFIVYVLSNVIFSLVGAHYKIHQELVLVACTVVVVKAYPVLVHNLFPDLYVSQNGAYFLTAIILGMYAKDRRIFRRGRQMDRGNTYHSMYQQASSLAANMKRKTG